MCKYIKNVKTISYQDRMVYGETYFPEEEGKHPIVIFSHGYNGNYSDFNGYGKYLASKGIATFGFDFCGGSARAKSRGKTTEMTIFSEKEDLLAVIRAVREWDMVDREAIYLFGASQGGLVTALAAEECHEEIEGMCLLFPAFCIPDDWNRKYPDLQSVPEEIDFWGMKLGKDYIQTICKYNISEHIGAFQQKVLFFHGDNDEIVPYQYSLEMAKQYAHAEVTIFPGEGHGFSMNGEQRVMEMVVELVTGEQIKSRDGNSRV